MRESPEGPNRVAATGLRDRMSGDHDADRKAVNRAEDVEECRDAGPVGILDIVDRQEHGPAA